MDAISLEAILVEGWQCICGQDGIAVMTYRADGPEYLRWFHGTGIVDGASGQLSVNARSINCDRRFGQDRGLGKRCLSERRY